MIEVTDLAQSNTPEKLPKGWQKATLADVVAEAQGGFACGERDPYGVIQLRMNNVTNRGQFDWSSLIRVPVEAGSAAYRLQPGDVLFNNTNSTELVGKTALFVGHNESVVFSNHFTRLRTRKDRLMPAFLALWLQHQWQSRVFAEICNRWIGQSAVQRDKLLSLQLPVPPLAEQQRIAAILTEQMAAVDRARIAAEAQLAAASQLPDAYLRAIFDSPEALQWTKVPLGDLAIVGPDNGAFKRRSEFGRGLPFVNVSDLYRSLTIDLDLAERVEASPGEQQRYAIAAGDLFFCRSSLKREGIGWCAYVRNVQEPAIFDCHVMRVRLNPDKALPEYVCRYWAHPAVREAVIGNSRTATMTTMNQDDLARVSIALPALDEQRRIVARLSEQMEGTQRARKALSEQLDTINELPATLLRRALNGEL